MLRKNTFQQPRISVHSIVDAFATGSLRRAIKIQLWKFIIRDSVFLCHLLHYLGSKIGMLHIQLTIFRNLKNQKCNFFRIFQFVFFYSFFFPLLQDGTEGKIEPQNLQSHEFGGNQLISQAIDSSAWWNLPSV